MSQGAPATMLALRLNPPGRIEDLGLEQVRVPVVDEDQVLVRVQAAAITRDELEWPTDRLPAIPSYELSGIVVGVGRNVTTPTIGQAVFGMMPFDGDGAAAEYAVLKASVLAPRPQSLTAVEAAALPLAGLTAWQGLFVHGDLRQGERVLIHGAAGGVGHITVQLARWRGAYVIGTGTGPCGASTPSVGAQEVIDRTSAAFEDQVQPVDLVFDTVGGDVLARSAAVLKPAGRLITVASEPPPGVSATYFVWDQTWAH